MFFALSKVLGFFLVPSNIMAGLGLGGIALLAIGYVGIGRWMLAASIVLVAGIGVLPIGNRLALPLETRFPRWDARRGPPVGIIVLGGGVIRAKTSTERAEIVLGGTAERIIAGAELACRYPHARVIFTGGNSNLIIGGPIEADFVVRLFEQLGTPQDRVIVEPMSRNTAENATFVKQLFMPNAGERWLLVTSAMHMPRAIGVFQKAGFAVDAYPVDYQTGNTEHRWSLYSALMNIRKTDQAVHEWIGLLAYWATRRISVPFPKPASDNSISAAPLSNLPSNQSPAPDHTQCN
jgi:uncharacterized SAM-binding protein YcdF (DUF218 family)